MEAGSGGVELVGAGSGGVIRGFGMGALGRLATPTTAKALIYPPNTQNTTRHRTDASGNTANSKPLRTHLTQGMDPLGGTADPFPGLHSASDSGSRRMRR